MRRPINFTGQTYQGRSRAIDSERSINWYAEGNSANSKEMVSLVPTPGAKRIATLPDLNRGGYSYNGLIWMIASNTVYTVTTGGTVTSKGTINSFNGNLSFADNGKTMLIVDGIDGYLYTKATDTLVQIADPDFPSNPIQVEYMDGYFIVLEGGSGRFWLSALDDGSSWNALDFATAEGSPDNLVGMKVNHRQLWLFGDSSTEIWYNSGDKDFPFRRIQGAFFEEGTLAAGSISKTTNAVLWLSNSERGQAAVYIASGIRPVRISTVGIELAFDGYSDLTDAISYVVYEETHTFYILTFPTAEKTWVYDLTTKMWHERSTNNARWWAQYGVIVGGALYGLDYASGRIMHVDHAYKDEDGQMIRRLRTGKHIESNRGYVECNSLEIEFEHGIGDVDTPNPQVMLRVSNDGGYTWSNEQKKSAGAAGDYQSRVVFNRLGTARDFVFEVSVTDPVNWVMVGAYADMKAVT